MTPRTWRESVHVPAFIPEHERLAYARREAVRRHPSTKVEDTMTPTLYQVSAGGWVVTVIGRVS